MPNDSGVYEDLDVESLSYELSPTDGYFNQRPDHPQDVLVPNPSQQTGEADKAREAQEERQANSVSQSNGAVSSYSQATHRSTPSRTRLDPDFEEDPHTERTPLISSAPPAYSAASADSQYHSPISIDQSGAADNRDYSTMGRPETFLPYGEPTDLGGAPLLVNSDDAEPRWRRTTLSWFSRSLGSFGRFFLILVALAIGVGFIADAIFNIHNRRSSHQNPDHPETGLDEMPGHGPAQCTSGIHTGSASFSFNSPSAFTFIELVSGVSNGPNAGLQQVHTSGELHVRQSSKHLEVNLRVDVEMHYSELYMMREIVFEHHETSLSLITPSHVSVGHGSSQRPCLYVVATLWIAPGADLEYLDIETQAMSVIFHGEVEQDTHAIDIHCGGSGSVTFPSGTPSKANTLSIATLSTKVDLSLTITNPRKIVISTRSGSVQGTFPLYDLLHIKSLSGSIQVDAEPKEASISDPQPAVLILESVSGTIHVNTPVLASVQLGSLASLIPSRDYQTTLESISGGLQATIIHGSRLRMTTSSASIRAMLSPFGPPEDESRINTSTESGSTSLTVLSSVSHPDKPLRKFYGDYKYSSGSLQVTYPKEWEGEVEGTTLTGSVTVDWPGLHLGRGGNNKGRWGWKTFRGSKGDGEGKLAFHGVSGSVTLRG